MYYESQASVFILKHLNKFLGCLIGAFESPASFARNTRNTCSYAIDCLLYYITINCMLDQKIETRRRYYWVGRLKVHLRPLNISTFDKSRILAL